MTTLQISLPIEKTQKLNLLDYKILKIALSSGITSYRQLYRSLKNIKCKVKIASKWISLQLHHVKYSLQKLTKLGILSATVNHHDQRTDNMQDSQKYYADTTYPPNTKAICLSPQPAQDICSYKPPFDTYAATVSTDYQAIYYPMGVTLPGEICQKIKSQQNKKLQNMADQILRYMETKTRRKFKSLDYRNPIISRLKEKYSLDDFKKIIDAKAKEWLKSDHMSKHFNPYTLFSKKHFSHYLETFIEEEKGNLKELSFVDRLLTNPTEEEKIKYGL